MKMQRKFIVQFSLQITFLSLLLLISIVSLIMGIGYYLTNSESYHDLHKGDESFFQSVIKQQDKGWQLKDKFKDAIKQQNGWLILLNEDGQLLYQYNVPSNKKVDYSLILNDEALIDTTVTKVEPVVKKPYIVVYSSENKAAITLKKFQNELDWSHDALPKINTAATVYLTDSNGAILDSINAKENKLTPNTVTELKNKNQFNTSYLTDEESGKTLIVSYKLIEWDDSAFITEFKKPFFIGLAIVFILLMICILFYAKKFGSPLLIMMNWIRQLGKKDYNPPLNKNWTQIFLNKNGKIKRKYKLYKELFETLEEVTLKLKNNDEQQQLIEKTREDWISSLSHDLKTPLSSISGYVKMLQSDYKWSKEEEEQFYQVMDEQAEYMKALIDDLTLTYRLKNGQLTIFKNKVDINEVIRRTIIQLVNRQDLKDIHFEFTTSTKSIFAEVDLTWFQRILDNLIMNAIKHNPTGTIIHIGVIKQSNKMTITIKDDGIGMDENTMNNLFNRYYRGTNTTEAFEGSGLGMAIAKQLILLHDGTIAVNSEVKKGTEIAISLPIFSP